MKRSKDTNQRMPQHDYRLALQSAVSWLGDRYLLAAPVSRLPDERKPFFVELQSWHAPRRLLGPRNRRH